MGVNVMSDNELVVFVVLEAAGAEEQRRLAAAVQEQIDSWVSTCPGFVSSRLHLSADGTKIVNHARWVDAGHYENKFLADPRKAGLDAAIREHALSVPTAYRCSVYGHAA
jgi:hypothetical protein